MNNEMQSDTLYNEPSEKAEVVRLTVDVKRNLGKFSLDIQFEHDSSRGILGILGSSGCGKSMTLKCISGVVRPDRGYIALGDHVWYSSAKRIFVKPRNRGVGHLFQDYALFPNMTVRDNVLAGMRQEKRENLARVESLLQSFYILDQADKYPRELSGGQKQRAALARVFASKPSILLLDEPFSALDEYIRYQLEQNLFEYLEQYDGIVLYVSHNRDEIRRFCDQVVVMEDGHAISYMPVVNLFESPWHFSSARLAGVRNFSHAEKRDTYEIFAKEWNTSLTVQYPVPDDIRLVGVRESSVRIVIPDGRTRDSQQGEVAYNVFSATVLRIVSGITSDTAVLLPYERDSDELFGKMFVTIDKTHPPLLVGDRVEIAIPETDIMCLK
ncbi:MAG TPA: ATP-binding cassette domain-containing protein [Clostridiaceae bacterium]|nr:ATP-binding cassette domain-containing protein [Clostridiaceae bacterium]